ncbi:hypothetical protein [Streptomyces sp. NPDC056244]|uniref:hypothetical protein n=1 Tax=Streptomyces sp. NPDC056244 TaxID=3345762 RepID=UPI0035DD772B
MSQSWKVAVLVAAGAGIVSTPLIWLLDGPDSGQLAGASVQAAAGIAALVWALFQPAAASPGPRDAAVGTGKAEATGGGSAHTGVRRRGGSGSGGTGSSGTRSGDPGSAGPGNGGTGSGSARAERTGDATAHGPGSSASTGIDYS